jgi:hypothetical protein
MMMIGSGMPMAHRSTERMKTSQQVVGHITAL